MMLATVPFAKGLAGHTGASRTTPFSARATRDARSVNATTRRKLHVAPWWRARADMAATQPVESSPTGAGRVAAPHVTTRTRRRCRRRNLDRGIEDIPSAPDACKKYRVGGVEATLISCRYAQCARSVGPNRSLPKAAVLLYNSHSEHYPCSHQRRCGAELRCGGPLAGSTVPPPGRRITRGEAF